MQGRGLCLAQFGGDPLQFRVRLQELPIGRGHAPHPRLQPGELLLVARLRLIARLAVQLHLRDVVHHKHDRLGATLRALRVLWITGDLEIAHLPGCQGDRHRLGHAGR